MELTKEAAEATLQRLREQLAAFVADAHRTEGAIQLLESMIPLFDEPEVNAE